MESRKRKVQFAGLSKEDECEPVAKETKAESSDEEDERSERKEKNECEVLDVS